MQGIYRFPQEFDRHALGKLASCIGIPTLMRFDQRDRKRQKREIK